MLLPFLIKQLTGPQVPADGMVHPMGEQVAGEGLGPCTGGGEGSGWGWDSQALSASEWSRASGPRAAGGRAGEERGDPGLVKGFGRRPRIPHAWGSGLGGLILLAGVLLQQDTSAV